jgi:hypothetical protein
VTILHYVCAVCRLRYSEEWEPGPNPHLGLCPRCGEFNRPPADALGAPHPARDRE